jgi:hypothetical protein
MERREIPAGTPMATAQAKAKSPSSNEFGYCSSMMSFTVRPG